MSRSRLPLALGTGLAAALVPFAVAPPAYAAGNVCALSGGTVTVTTPGLTELAISIVSGNLAVDAPQLPQTCTDAGGAPIAVAPLTSIVLANTGATTSYTIPTPAAWGAAITVQNDTADRLVLVGTDLTDTITTTGVRALSLGGGTTLTVAATPAYTEVDLGDGDDVADLGAVSPWTGTTILVGRQGDDVLAGGSALDSLIGDHATDTISGDGDDTLTGGAGDDVAAPGGGADTVDLGPGSNTAHVWAGDGSADTIDGSHDDPEAFDADPTPDTISVGGPWHAFLDLSEPGFDGKVNEGDAWTGFEKAISSSAGFGLEVSGWEGEGLFTFQAESPETDVLVSGPGQEEFFANNEFDIADYGQTTGNGVIVFGYFSTDKQVTGHGGDYLHGVQTFHGSPWPDDFDLSGLDVAWIRPRGGDDSAGGAGITHLESEPESDGGDSLTCLYLCTWSYAQRTEPIRVTVDSLGDDGFRDDGEAGEGDDIRTAVEDQHSPTVVLGGAANDTLVGSTGADVLVGHLGHDTLTGRGGDDQLWGAEGDDRLYGGGGADELRGQQGHDTLLGHAGDDSLFGDLGNDRLDGGTGDDTELGEDGNDTFDQGSIASENGSDELVGGPGTDAVTYLGRTAGVTVSNNGGWDDGNAGEGDSVRSSVEKLVGTNAADQLLGGLLADLLFGNGGKDLLRGGGGNDTLDGGTAADSLYGEAGNDILYAKDALKDLRVDGGSGTDKARRDSTDPVFSVESFF